MSDTITLPRFKVGDTVTTKATDSIPNASGVVTSVFAPGEDGGYKNNFYYRFKLDQPVTRTYGTTEHVHEIIGRTNNELC